ncbi:PDDEXK nuclease domain-containing protein, partial [Elusimicrobiota bacterium]
MGNPLPIYARVRDIIESARAGAARSVNSAQVVSNWLIGREIVEEQQKGRARAEYGKQLIEKLSKRLMKEFGRGFTIRNLETFRVFYLEYPGLAIPHALRADLTDGASQRTLRAARRKPSISPKLPAIPQAVRAGSWRPGRLHPNLSWTHYRRLLRVDKVDVRAFYEIEAIKNDWSARELERQINSLLHERLALSRDKKGLMRLALKGQEARKPADIFKDPVVMEFLGLPESPRLVETELERALIGNLQAFLLEMGAGFAFVARQERLTLDGDHFFIDLVFYHTILKCFVVIDLLCGAPHNSSSVASPIMWRSVTMDELY